MKTNYLIALTAAFGFAAVVPLVATQAGGQSDRATHARRARTVVRGDG